MSEMSKSLDALVQIEKSDIPPLRQSIEMLMACKKNYATQVIQGKKQPGGLESARGLQVHRTGALYGSHCAQKGVSMDLDAFDQLSKGAGPLAAKILSGMRESYQVDFTALLATELRMSLDENFDPTDAAPEIEGESGDSGLAAHYSGTLDMLYVYRDEKRGAVHDLKTHPRPYDPEETLQAKMYSVFVFKHFPWMETVLFRLIFCRYKNLVRDVTYKREDLPSLIEAIRAARERQKMIHAEFDAGQEMEATPGPQCVYCPLLSNRACPIAAFNYEMQLSIEDRLRYSLWYSAFSAVNNKALKDHIQGTGRNVVIRDYNGKCYSYGPVEKESSTYPLFRKTENGIATDPQGNPVMPIVGLLMDYAHATPDDTSWMGSVLISSTSLNKYLGTKKRAILDIAVSDSADKITKATLKVSKPLDSIEDEPEDTEEEWESDEF